MITVSDQYDDYGQEIVQRLRKQQIRAELAPSSDTVSKKVRTGATRKIPNLLIVGERERAERTVTLRRYGHKDQHTLALDVFESRLLASIRSRAQAFLLPD